MNSDKESEENGQETPEITSELEGKGCEALELIEKIGEMFVMQEVNFSRRINDAISDNRLFYKNNNFYITQNGVEHAIYRPGVLSRLGINELNGEDVESLINQSIKDNDLSYRDGNYHIIEHGIERPLLKDEIIHPYKRPSN